MSDLRGKNLPKFEDFYDNFVTENLNNSKMVGWSGNHIGLLWKSLFEYPDTCYWDYSEFLKDYIPFDNIEDYNSEYGVDFILTEDASDSDGREFIFNMRSDNFLIVDDPEKRI